MCLCYVSLPCGAVIWCVVADCGISRPYPLTFCVAYAESFVRGGPNLIDFFLKFSFSWWGNIGSKYHYKWAIFCPPAKRHLNGVLLAGRWWPNIECWLGSFVVFQGIRTSIAKKPYIFVIFQGAGGLDHLSHPLGPPMYCGIFRSYSLALCPSLHYATQEPKRIHVHLSSTKYHNKYLYSHIQHL